MFAAIGPVFSRPRRLATALVVSLGIAAGAAVAAPKDAENFVRGQGAEAIAVLSKPGLSDAQYMKEFNTFVDRNFDVPAMAQFAMGVYWRQATPAQRDEYVKLFKDYFISTYAGRFRQYTGEKFEVFGARPINSSENLVQTRITRPNNPQPVNIDWHVRQQGNEQKVVDLIIEGLRLGVTLRDEFSGVIQQGGGLEALLKALRDKTLVIDAPARPAQPPA